MSEELEELYTIFLSKLTLFKLEARSKADLNIDLGNMIKDLEEQIQYISEELDINLQNMAKTYNVDEAAKIFYDVFWNLFNIVRLYDKLVGLKDTVHGGYSSSILKSIENIASSIEHIIINYTIKLVLEKY